MENKLSEDIGEEVISKLKELNRILERILQRGKDSQDPDYFE